MSFGLIVVIGLLATAFWCLAFLVWVGRRERLEKKQPELDYAAALTRRVHGGSSWRDRYIRGEIDLDEFEEHWDE